MRLQRKLVNLPKVFLVRLGTTELLLWVSTHLERIVALPGNVKQRSCAVRQDALKGVLVAVNMIAERFVHDTIILLAVCFQNHRMYAMYVAGAENAKQTEPTILHSKQMQCQKEDTPTPEVKYRQEEKSLKDWMSWFRH